MAKNEARSRALKEAWARRKAAQGARVVAAASAADGGAVIARRKLTVAIDLLVEQCGHLAVTDVTELLLQARAMREAQ